MNERKRLLDNPELPLAKNVTLKQKILLKLGLDFNKIQVVIVIRK